jgi:hypothetical protein
LKAVVLLLVLVAGSEGPDLVRSGGMTKSESGGGLNALVCA